MAKKFLKSINFPNLEDTYIIPRVDTVNGIEPDPDTGDVWISIGNGTLTGSGAPTEKTVGKIGELYMDTDTGDLYKCTSVNTGRCYWRPVDKALIVTYDSKSNSSHSPNLINSHIAYGGTAFFFDGEEYFSLLVSKPNESVFWKFDEAGNAWFWYVYDDCTVESFIQEFASINQVNEIANNTVYVVNVWRGAYDNSTNQFVYTTEHFNWDELQNAVKSGKAVCCRVWDAEAFEVDGFIDVYNYQLNYFSTEENLACFDYFQAGDGTTTRLVISPDGTIDPESITDSKLGDISTALDSIIAIQEALIGGES